MDDNLFDEDDALDYVMSEECEKQVEENHPTAGSSIFFVKPLQ